MTNNEEIWKPVVGYEGLYEVSNFGRIKAPLKIVRSGRMMRKYQERIITQQHNKLGYLCVVLYKDGKGKRYLVHRLVMLAFVPNTENKPHIDHINTIKDDNRLENLRWATPKENANNELTVEYMKSAHSKESYKRGQETKRKNGVRNAPVKVYQYSKEGLLIAEYPSANAAGALLGIPRKNISRAINDHTLSAGGYMWRTDGIPQCEPYLFRSHPFSKPIIQYDLNGNIIQEWKSIYEASQELKIPTSNIRRSIRRKGKPRRYMFRFKDGSL